MQLFIFKAIKENLTLNNLPSNINVTENIVQCG